MEEKERYEIHIYDDICVDLYDNGVLDKSINDTYKLEELLNQQDKRIKELEEDQALLTILISGIDNLMHDKDYRFKNDNGTWYSRQSCKDLTNEEVYQEIIDEINQLDSNFEILDKENQQLKQQLAITEKALELACEPRDDWGGEKYSGTEYDNYYDYFMAEAKEMLENE